MPGDNVEMTLYIPLCFLLIGFRDVVVPNDYMLYIPLCFLLIPPLNNTLIPLLLQPHIVDLLF